MNNITPLKFSTALQKVHEAFYGKKLITVKIIEHEVQLKYKDEFFSVENYIETRYRITFPDYVGKISDYRNFFGHIMGNADNICDTSDFIDLPKSHVSKIYDFIDKMNLISLVRYKSI